MSILNFGSRQKPNNICSAVRLQPQQTIRFTPHQLSRICQETLIQKKKKKKNRNMVKHMVTLCIGTGVHRLSPKKTKDFTHCLLWSQPNEPSRTRLNKPSVTVCLSLRSCVFKKWTFQFSPDFKLIIFWMIINIYRNTSKRLLHLKFQLHTFCSVFR